MTAQARDSALALFSQGRWAEAEPPLAASLTATPDDPALLRALAQLRFAAQRLPEALALMDRVLAQMPNDAGALNSRGAILTASGRVAEALEAFDAALRLDPSLVRAHANRAVALAALGRPEEALQAAEAALVREPGNAGALASRGMALLSLGRAADAVPALQAAIAADPANLSARLDLAAALIATDAFAQASDTLAPVLAAHPTLRPALLLQARALHGARRFEDALALSRRMLEADAGDADAVIAEGNALAALNRHAESLAAFQRAAALRPDDPVAHNNIGNALSVIGRHADALVAFDRALACDAGHADAHANRGMTLLALERQAEALVAFDAALALGAGNDQLHLARAYTLLDLDRPAEAIAGLLHTLERDPASPTARVALLHARRLECDWRDEARLLPGLDREIIARASVVQPWSLLALVDDPAAHLAAMRVWMVGLYPAAPAIWRGERYDHARIRLAYISTDFRDHAVSRLAVGLFEKHDRARFQTFAIALGAPPTLDDAMRPRLMRAFDEFLPVHDHSDEAIARLIRAREIDILVDLNGQTRGARTAILAQRPAPVQVGFLGYPGSAAVEYMDYIIADPVVIPPEDHGFYSEAIATLPDTFFPADDRRAIGAVPSRAAAGLPAQGFIFCAFNGRQKIAPALFDIWMRLLAAVPGSVLWLSHMPDVAAANLRREAEARGIAGARLIIAPRVAMEAHLARHACADLFLDTLPYNAHTTASDALWSGLPVLTTPGRGFAGRVATSLLRALGMDELIAPTLAEHETTALALARDPARLAALRATLAARRRSTPAFDTERHCRHLENAFVTMRDRTQRGLTPASFAVPPRH